MLINHSSCCTTKSISLLCENNEVELFVDDNAVGSGLVNYIIPNKTQVVTITARLKGKEVYNQQVYIRNRYLYEIDVEDFQTYTSSPVIYKSK